MDYLPHKELGYGVASITPNKRPTLKTVAQAAGVSLPTVSQVLRGVGRISEERRQAVLKAADMVGYVPDHRAISVRTGCSKEVGMIVHHLANSFNAEIIARVADVLEDYGYFLSVMDARGDPLRLEKLVRIMLSKNCAGLLWVPSEKVDPSLVSLIDKQQVPSVTFLRGLTGTSFPSLRVANEVATHKATCHLIELGHRHIAFAGGEGDNQTRRMRIAGYQRALTEASLASTQVFDLPDNKSSGFDFAKILVEQHADISAVVCNGDEFAIGLCFGLQRLGFIPGKDLSVIGFDDIDEAELITPSLTTLSISPSYFGETLATMLLACMAGEISTDGAEQFVRVDLVIRETTSAVSHRNSDCS